MAFGARDALPSLARGVVAAALGSLRDLGAAARLTASTLPLFLRGRPREALRSLGGALVRLAALPAGVLLMFGGRLIAIALVVGGRLAPGRRLTEAERATLEQVFAGSVDLSRIRVREGPLPLRLPKLSGSLAFVHGDDVYVLQAGLPLAMPVLVHETVHVWQHQHGGTFYMASALWAQSMGDGYDFAKALREGRGWAQLNPEQQGALIEWAYRQGFFQPGARRLVVGGCDFTPKLEEAIAELRAGRGAP